MNLSRPISVRMADYGKPAASGQSIYSGRLTSIARHGATLAREAAGRKQPISPENVTYWATRLADGLNVERHGVMCDPSTVTMLPESAFDWPIYRAARDTADLFEALAASADPWMHQNALGCA